MRSPVPGLQSVFFPHDLANALERHIHPIGAIIELIGEFVNRLVEDKQIQQQFHLVARLREKSGLSRAGEITFDEGNRHPDLPIAPPFFERGAVFWSETIAARRETCRIAERPQHAGNVL